jgi:hypothetical protein
MSLTRSTRWLLTVGSLAFGAWGLLNPRGLGRAVGDRSRTASWMGVRDALVGAALMRYSGPVPLLARAAADVGDAVRLRRRSPGVAAAALGFAVLGTATAVAGMKGRGR